jgi:hypothetical protein
MEERWFESNIQSLFTTTKPKVIHITFADIPVTEERNFDSIHTYLLV